MSLYKKLCERLPVLIHHLTDTDNDIIVLRALQDYLFHQASTREILVVIEDLLPTDFIKVWEFPRATRSRGTNVYSLYRSFLQGREVDLDTSCYIGSDTWWVYEDVLKDFITKNPSDRRIANLPSLTLPKVDAYKGYVIYDIRKSNLNVQDYFLKLSKLSREERAKEDIKNVVFSLAYYGFRENRVSVIPHGIETFEKSLFKADTLVNMDVSEVVNVAKELADQHVFDDIDGLRMSLLASNYDDCTDIEKKELLKKMVNVPDKHPSYLRLFFDVPLNEEHCDRLRHGQLRLSNPFHGQDANLLYGVCLGNMTDPAIRTALKEVLEKDVFAFLPARINDFIAYRLLLPNALTDLDKSMFDMVMPHTNDCVLAFVHALRQQPSLWSSTSYIFSEEPELM